MLQPRQDPRVGVRHRVLRLRLAFTEPAPRAGSRGMHRPQTDRLLLLPRRAGAIRSALSKARRWNEAFESASTERFPGEVAAADADPSTPLQRHHWVHAPRALVVWLQRTIRARGETGHVATPGSLRIRRLLLAPAHGSVRRARPERVLHHALARSQLSAHEADNPPSITTWPPRPQPRLVMDYPRLHQDLGGASIYRRLHTGST